MAEELRDKRGLTEAEAIARYKSRNYPKPALTADIIVFCRRAAAWEVLLIRRGGHPYLGKLALPGGFADEHEAVEVTAARELEEETGVGGLALTQVGVFSRPGRDPRGWVVSVAFAAVVQEQALQVQAGSDAACAQWFKIVQAEGQTVLQADDQTVLLQDLAFDHGEILLAAMEKMGI